MNAVGELVGRAETLSRLRSEIDSSRGGTALFLAGGIALIAWSRRRSA